MPVRTIATLAIAVVLGLGAVLLAQNWLGRQRKADVQSAALAGTTAVVVAAQPIARGVALQPAILKVVRYPQGSVPAGALTSLDQATLGGQRLVLRPIEANEPILSSKITTPGGKANLSAAMTPGSRAVTFRSNDVAGVAGFVLPGDRVDVLLTRDTGGANSSGANGSTLITQVVADGLKVLGVDQLSDDSSDKPVVAKAITLEVTPEQAQAISLAQAVGTVSLALRQISDDQPVAKRITNINDLGGFRAAATPAVYTPAPRPAAPRRLAPRPSGATVQVTRGLQTTDYSVAIR